MRKKAQNVRAFLIYSDANKLFLKLIFACWVYNKTVIPISVGAL